MSWLEEVQSTALQIATELPERHTITRPFRGGRFKRAVDEFIRVVYQLEWKHFESVQDFALVEALTQTAIGLVQYHMLAKYGEADTAECSVFRDRIEALRVALDGLRRGLPPDPRKRPTAEELESATAPAMAAALEEFERRHQLASTTR